MNIPNRRRVEQINDMWGEDSRIHFESLLEETDRHYVLHKKYNGLLIEETRRLRDISNFANKLRFRLIRFYTVGPTTKEEKEHAEQEGWPLPPEGRPDKTHVKYWVDTNDDMIKVTNELAEQNDIVESLHRIMKAIDGRSYSIGHAIKMKVHNDGGR
jgi:Recombination, repair and ssDNA binding protein UvsY